MNGEISGKFLGNDTDICYNERLLILDMRNKVDPCNTLKKNTSQHISRNKEFSVFANFANVEIFSIPHESASLLCK